MPSIPQKLVDKYYEFADDFINSNFGVLCTLYYEPLFEACPGCSDGMDSLTNRAIGGIPIPGILCGICGGSGHKEVQTTENIKLRVYHDIKKFKDYPGLSIPEGTIRVIGFTSDLPKFLNAQKIAVNVTQSNYVPEFYVRKDEPRLHGFGRKRYFISYMEKHHG